MNKDLELLACFDESGKPIEPKTRKEVHSQPYKIWHAVTNIWVIKQGLNLCTKRSFKNEGNPGKWQTYVGGHVQYGHGFEETAVKELKEELGLMSDMGKPIFIGQERYEPAEHITAMYAFFWSGSSEDIHPIDGEINEAKWMNYDDYLADKETNPENWCNNIRTETYQKILKVQRAEVIAKMLIS